MIPDNNQHVIVESSHGSFYAYPCSVENARKLLNNHLEGLAPESSAIRAARLSENKYLVSHDRIAAAFQEVVDGEVGSATRHLRALLHGNRPEDSDSDTRPEVILTQEMKDKLVLWCFKHKFDVRRLESLDCEVLTSELNAGQLPFSEGLIERAKLRVMLVAQDWALDAAAELRILLDVARWKETAMEHKVVQRYLTFINEQLVNSRFTEYQVAELQTTP